MKITTFREIEKNQQPFFTTNFSNLTFGRKQTASQPAGKVDKFIKASKAAYDKKAPERKAAAQARMEGEKAKEADLISKTKVEMDSTLRELALNKPVDEKLSELSKLSKLSRKDLLLDLFDNKLQLVDEKEGSFLNDYAKKFPPNVKPRILAYLRTLVKDDLSSRKVESSGPELMHRFQSILSPYTSYPVTRLTQFGRRVINYLVLTKNKTPLTADIIRQYL